MTISYTAEVASCQNFGFLKLLFRWKGSIYKLVWMDLLVFLTLYYILNLIYRFALTEDAKEVFEGFVHYCRSYGTLIPLSFVLGFYVSLVMQRWWEQYIVIPWPDPVAVYVSVHVHGQDERGRVMRRTVMRYVCLCLTMVLTMISPRVKKRFPTMDHLVEAGLLLENEKDIIASIDVAFPKHPKHWMPIVWAASIITRARKEGRIRDDFAVKTIIDELNKFRGKCGVLMYFDSISIPLVYTQVVTLAVYTYFLCSVMSYQWTEQKSDKGYINYIDCYFPIFSTLQFFFYMGWLKVAESLINPFGEDDDDFEVNWIIDRNLQVSYLIVDEMHHEHPELVKDQYWDEIFPNELPYGHDPSAKREEPPVPSTAKLVINPSTKIQSQAQFTNGKSNATSRYVLSADGGHISRAGVNTRLVGPKSSGDLTNRQTPYATRSPPSVRDPTVRISENVRIQEPSTQDRSTTETEPISIPHAALPKLHELFKQHAAAANMESTSSTHNMPSSDGNMPLTASDDDFERLRAQRERERLERQRKRMISKIADLRNEPADSDVWPDTSRPTTAAPSSKSSITKEPTDENEEKKNKQKPSDDNKEE